MKDACPKGHPYDEANTYVNPRTGHRLCRACQRDFQRRRRQQAGAGTPSGQRTHCPQGHPYDDNNTGRKANGHRYCRSCISERERARSQDPARRDAARQLALARYGITVEQYGVMFEAQGGVCAICGRGPGKKALHVDHNHETGEVRGLLCSNCNTAIGLLGESLASLEKAMAYLKGAAPSHA